MFSLTHSDVMLGLKKVVSSGGFQVVCKKFLYQSFGSKLQQLEAEQKTGYLFMQGWKKLACLPKLEMFRYRSWKVKTSLFLLVKQWIRAISIDIKMLTSV